MAELSVPDAWPVATPRGEALPRVEELPLAEHGYDPEAVEAAFDAFYRHLGRLDATLRALESVDAFHRDAAALRGDLLALRRTGLAGRPARPAVAPRATGTVVRLGAETALLVAVATLAGVADLRPLAIVALMAAAFAVVAVSEWIAAR